MGTFVSYESTHCSYAQSGNWASSNTKNPIYIGNNSAGTYKYVGQWYMPPLDQDYGEISSVTLNIYRNSANSSSAREYYVGCSSSSTDYASVLSTGVKFTLNAGEGWNKVDVSGIAPYIKDYTSTWYLLIGNPNNNGTYAEVAGYGTYSMLNLDILFEDGSRIYLASDGSLNAYQIYRAEKGSLTRYDLYRGEGGSLVKY